MYIDVDECLLSHNCDEHALCQNGFGSFTCTCVHGYSGNGTHCSKFDVCIDL